MPNALFTLSVFCSAFLLFLLQPMLARLLLPVYGGSPGVWNTCMVFFQVVLLAGYAYAHGSLRRLGMGRQRLLHAALLVGSLALLPRVSFVMLSAPGGSLGSLGSLGSIIAILVALTVMAGGPFFVLSSNSSLTQRWYATRTAGDAASDPFRLYAASNAGSLAALLLYPAIVEPWFGVHAQLRWWGIGYAAFVALSLVTMVLARPHAAPGVDDPMALTGDAIAVTVRSARRAGWVVRAAVASSLLLSITMQITTDVVSAPLFWVLPLAIYLGTFIVAFSPAHRPARSRVAYATTIGVALCLVLALIPTLFPLWFALIVLLGTLFTGALLCHGDLFDDRPAVGSLTEFYLWISLGGAIGGIANGIVAPLVFRSVAEYPLTLVALALLIPGAAHSATARARLRALATSVPALAMFAAVLMATAFVLVGRHANTAAGAGLFRWQFMPVAVLVAGVLFASQRDHFQLATALSAAFLLAGLHFIDPIIDQGRSFFGVSRVTESATERILIHGVTVHGAQRLDPALRDIPTSYYWPAGPLGWAVANAPPGATIGVIGLGAGSLAPLTHAGQQLAYFEIDPLVESMARRDFTYLADAPATVTVTIGDGRQLVASVPDNHFDLLMLDAFTSDAIPTHLLTAEALALYLRKLKPNGLLVAHISNRYADLSRVFRGWSQATGLRVAIDQYVPSDAEQAAGVRATVAVAMARTPAALLRIAQTRQWYWLDADGPSVLWTDDHINLLAVLDRDMLKP